MDDPTGVCLWFTGPSGAGKSTVTGHLVPMLEARGRTVTVLDVVPELAKHWAERTSEGKLIRKAFVAREVVRHGGIVICVTVSARRDVRSRARSLIGEDRFVEVFFDAPPQVTSERRAARTKKPPLLKRIRRFARRVRRLGRPTAEYQRPTSADLTLSSVDASAEANATAILRRLVERGDVTPDDRGSTGAEAGAGRDGTADSR